MIDPLSRNINKLFVQYLEAGENGPTRNSFDKYYMPLLEMKDFNALINNKPFCNQPIRIIEEAYENLWKCKEATPMQQENY